MQQFLVKESSEIFPLYKMGFFMGRFRMANINFQKKEKVKVELQSLPTFGNWKMANGN
ncbi:hypothetical protein MG290_01120 [Flavobacterium sp. CBA20B-1]|uniref:hypothetical protein n=1 Tax=unclassified Flavobacterium TaxID=196869 RepID=UPI0022256981|nr:MULTISPECIES: hypothetical protein [unclassified Flavobacterium]WCM42302.1 hypothetical protein MG290_01120 [Flavobacterium sp. CBA20B-1]